MSRPPKQYIFIHDKALESFINLIWGVCDGMEKFTKIICLVIQLISNSISVLGRTSWNMELILRLDTDV